MQRRKSQILEQGRGDHQADGWNVVEPFKVGVPVDVLRHHTHPDTGQR